MAKGKLAVWLAIEERVFIIVIELSGVQFELKSYAWFRFEITSMISDQNLTTRGSITTLLSPLLNCPNTGLGQFKYFINAVLSWFEIEFIHFTWCDIVSLLRNHNNYRQIVTKFSTKPFSPSEEPKTNKSVFQSEPEVLPCFEMN